MDSKLYLKHIEEAVDKMDKRSVECLKNIKRKTKT
jgi:hypothetical protein